MRISNNPGPDAPDNIEEIQEHEITTENILEHAQENIARLMRLMHLKTGNSAEQYLITDGTLSDNEREEKMIFNSDHGNGFGLVIRRLGENINLITEVDIYFYPHNWKKINLMREIEKGLANEWAKKFKKLHEAGNSMEKQLRLRGCKGMPLSRLTVAFTRDEGTSEGCVAIYARLFLNLADETNLLFDPIKLCGEIREDSGLSARIVYKRYLEMLANSILEEEMHIISSALREVIKPPSVTN